MRHCKQCMPPCAAEHPPDKNGWGSNAGCGSSWLPASMSCRAPIIPALAIKAITPCVPLLLAQALSALLLLSLGGLSLPPASDGLETSLLVETPTCVAMQNWPFAEIGWLPVLLCNGLCLHNTQCFTTVMLVNRLHVGVWPAVQGQAHLSCAHGFDR